MGWQTNINSGHLTPKEFVKKYITYTEQSIELMETDIQSSNRGVIAAFRDVENGKIFLIAIALSKDNGDWCYKLLDFIMYAENFLDEYFKKPLSKKLLKFIMENGMAIYKSYPDYFDDYEAYIEYVCKLHKKCEGMRKEELKISQFRKVVNNLLEGDTLKVGRQTLVFHSRISSQFIACYNKGNLYRYKISLLAKTYANS